MKKVAPPQGKAQPARVGEKARTGNSTCILSLGLCPFTAPPPPSPSPTTYTALTKVDEPTASPHGKLGGGIRGKGGEINGQEFYWLLRAASELTPETSGREKDRHEGIKDVNVLPYFCLHLSLSLAIISQNRTK